MPASGECCAPTIQAKLDGMSKGKVVALGIFPMCTRVKAEYVPHNTRSMAGRWWILQTLPGTDLKL
jgi:hypothetical protein